MPALLIILSGLPGAGKTAIARTLARRLDAVHVRIDSIEQAIRDSGVVVVSIDDAGYRVGYAVAEDNLRVGRTVIADSVNPLAATRTAWRGAAVRAGAVSLDVEVVCSDRDEHRRRVETREPRTGRQPGLSWGDVMSREYDGWDDNGRLVIDTAGITVDAAVAAIARALPADR